MNPKMIFYPLFGQVMLTILVWFYMYYERISEMKKKRVRTQDLADAGYAAATLKESVNSSDNLENLFEIPILFYVAIFVIFVLGLGDFIYLYLASAYVVLRAAHSVIHCTYNKVIHRFATYALSTLVLWAIWTRIGIQLFSN